MDRSTALDRLRSMLASDVDPVLGEDVLVALLADNAVADRAGNAPTNDSSTAGSWVASTAVLPGAIILEGDRYWVAVLGGSTAATEPTWPDLAGIDRDEHRTITDGGVRWADNGTTWAPTWDLTRAAADGWDRKAAIATSRYDFQTDDQRFSRAQVAASCREQADRFRRRLAGTTVTS